MTRFPCSGLYAVTPEQAPKDDLASAVEKAVRGGAVVVQYRAKSTHVRAIMAPLLLAVCRNFGVPLIINDDPALADRIGADGVHLGRNDRPLAEARAFLKPDALIGVSCYDSIERAEEAENQGADYVAFGRFFPSRTKPLATPARLETLREARQRLTVPIVAIGGITAENGGLLIEAGADVLAVVDDLFGEDDPERAARSFRNLFAR